MTALLDDFDPKTATDTEKVNAVLTILNIAVDVRESTDPTEGTPVQRLMQMAMLCTETLDAIEWALNTQRPPSKFGNPNPTGFNPAS